MANFVTVDDADVDQDVVLQSANRKTLRVHTAPGSAVLADPLTQQFWVDRNSTVTPATGSVLAPFTSLQSAYDAAVLAGLSQLNIIVVATDSAEDLTLSAALPNVALIAMTESIEGSQPAHFRDIVTTGGAAESISVVRCRFRGVTNDALFVSLYGCALDGGGAMVVPSGFLVMQASFPVGAYSWNVGGFRFTDQLSEQAVLGSGGITLVSTGAMITEGIVTPARFGRDASSVSWAATSQQRIVYWRDALSAVRTLTLSTGGVGVGRRATVDVYPQGFALAVVDGGGSGTLYTFAASASPRRAQFIFGGANWALANQHVLG